MTDWTSGDIRTICEELIKEKLRITVNTERSDYYSKAVQVVVTLEWDDEKLSSDYTMESFRPD